jgi:hypothetical protein
VLGELGVVTLVRIPPKGKYLCWDVKVPLASVIATPSAFGMLRDPKYDNKMLSIFYKTLNVVFGGGRVGVVGICFSKFWFGLKLRP